MYQDLQGHRNIVFIGISQASLAGYLSHILERTEPLPWSTIQVFFASVDIGTQIGTLQQRASFLYNIRKSRQEISSLLTENRYISSIPNFTEVQLFQYGHSFDHGGSMYSNRPLMSVGRSDFEVIYVVHSRILHRTDLKEGLTIRLESLPEGHSSVIHEARIRHYVEAYQTIRSEARHLGTFTRDLWDLSAEQWSAYARWSGTLKQSMAAVVSLAEVRDDETVLELGAGSGETSEPLIEAVTARGGTTVLLDGSPQMVAMASAQLHKMDRVEVALCRLPTRDLEDFDIANRQFSLLVIHHSFDALVSSCGGIEILAAWCRQRLSDGGRIIIAVHNTVVETDPPTPFPRRWRDPLRVALTTELGLPRRTAVPAPRFRPSEIENAFVNSGFVLKKVDRLIIPLTMAERVQMWRVPAIIGSICNVNLVGIENLSQVMDRVDRRVGEQITMPRTVTFWIFGKSPGQPAPERALRVAVEVGGVTEGATE
jgi:SAM-dependent methyltransferase